MDTARRRFLEKMHELRLRIMDGCGSNQRQRTMDEYLTRPKALMKKESISSQDA